jgi:hypothetical protein
MPLPCRECERISVLRSAAGSVVSEAKVEANRKKAKAAALKRWHPELFQE